MKKRSSVEAKQAGTASASRAPSVSSASTGSAHGRLAQAPQAVGPVAASPPEADSTYVNPGKTSGDAHQADSRRERDSPVHLDYTWAGSMKYVMPAATQQEGLGGADQTRIDPGKATLHHWAWVKVDITSGLQLWKPSCPKKYKILLNQ
ncbi:uncharacterized protein LOC121836786 [Ixodes scapularis]|uniref:uncharacterized protein LOC121836786 n=1 Tax=Ixodes scapularis TaxID=6945 RepID=UPI001C38521D|nr:uncharacterized protein LOC121836786 [Ixodes scapularis]